MIFFLSIVVFILCSVALAWHQHRQRYNLAGFWHDFTPWEPEIEEDVRRVKNKGALTRYFIQGREIFAISRSEAERKLKHLQGLHKCKYCNAWVRRPDSECWNAPAV